MQCPKCGTDNKEGSAWCNLCQEPLPCEPGELPLEPPGAGPGTAPRSDGDVEFMINMQALLEQANKKPGRKCLRHIEELGRLGDSRATDLLLSLSEHEKLREAVFKALAQIGDPEAESFMLRFVMENKFEWSLRILRAYEENCISNGGKPAFHVSLDRGLNEHQPHDYILCRCPGEMTLLEREATPWYEMQ